MYSGYTEEIGDGYSIRVEHWRIDDANPDRQQVRGHLEFAPEDLQYLVVPVDRNATDAEAMTKLREACEAASIAHAEEQLLAGLEGGEF